LDGLDLHRQGLRLSSTLLGSPFGQDLRDDDDDRGAKHERVLQPGGLNWEAQKLFEAKIGRGRKAGDEDDERQQRRRSAEHLAR